MLGFVYEAKSLSATLHEAFSGVESVGDFVNRVLQFKGHEFLGVIVTAFLLGVTLVGISVGVRGTLRMWLGPDDKEDRESDASDPDDSASRK